MLQEAPRPEQTILDRCDVCCGRAQVFVVLKSGGKLQWCSHHWNANESAVKPRCSAVIDERDDPDA